MIIIEQNGERISHIVIQGGDIIERQDMHESLGSSGRVVLQFGECGCSFCKPVDDDVICEVDDKILLNYLKTY